MAKGQGSAVIGQEQHIERYAHLTNVNTHFVGCLTLDR
jgi:hypothetical protein